MERFKNSEKDKLKVRFLSLLRKFVFILAQLALYKFSITVFPKRLSVSQIILRKFLLVHCNTNITGKKRLIYIKLSESVVKV